MIKWSIELYRCREKLCSIRRAVNDIMCMRSSFRFGSMSGESQGNAHWFSFCFSQHLPKMSSNISRRSTQWYNSHLPHVHDLICFNSVNSWSWSQFFNLSISALQSAGTSEELLLSLDLSILMMVSLLARCYMYIVYLFIIRSISKFQQSTSAAPSLPSSVLSNVSSSSRSGASQSAHSIHSAPPFRQHTGEPETIRRIEIGF